MPRRSTTSSSSMTAGGGGGGGSGSGSTTSISTGSSQHHSTSTVSSRGPRPKAANCVVPASPSPDSSSDNASDHSDLYQWTTHVETNVAPTTVRHKKKYV